MLTELGKNAKAAARVLAAATTEQKNAALLKIATRWRRKAKRYWRQTPWIWKTAGRRA
jgi:gamma-glutamyl phosphate reductase